jgi:hypothetical protein
MRQNAVGQLMPWSCPIEQLIDLKAALRDLGLVFSAIDSFSTDQKLIGVVHSPFFVAEEGLVSIPSAMSWDALEQGEVRRLIRTAPPGVIPGSEAEERVVTHFLSRLQSMPLNPPDTFFGTEHDFPKGLPVDLSNRKIVLERFHSATADVDEAHCSAVADGIQNQLRRQYPSLREAEVSFAPFSTDWFPILRLAIEWKPQLLLSSADAFIEVEKGILRQFDTALPRRSKSYRPNHRTFAVVSLCGNIHFNQDYWDHWTKS